MTNLIEQMNALKQLRDEELQSEIQQPSGSAPPFLVLGEISRRKDMRKRYEGAVANRAGRKTVAEEMTGAPPPPAAAALRPPPAPSMGAPAGSMPAPGGLTAPGAAPGFARGGLIDYDSLAQRYNERLEGMSGDKDNARAMALLLAGAGIMSGGHQNTLQNVGQGISAAVPYYQDQVRAIDSEEMNLLRGLTDIGQLQTSLEENRADRASRETSAEADRELSRERLGFEKTPADILKFREYQNMSPEDQAAYLQLNPPYNPNAMTNDLRLTEAANKAFEQALDSLPEPKSYEMIDLDPAEVARERQKQAAMLAYPKWVSILGEAGAAAMARQYGLSDGDILVGGTAPVLDEKDPLGLGL